MQCQCQEPPQLPVARSLHSRRATTSRMRHNAQQTVVGSADARSWCASPFTRTMVNKTPDRMLMSSRSVRHCRELYRHENVRKLDAKLPDRTRRRIGGEEFGVRLIEPRKIAWFGEQHMN